MAINARQAATTIPITAGVDMPAPAIVDVDLVINSSSFCNKKLTTTSIQMAQSVFLTFVTVLPSIMSSVVVCKIVISIVSMETGGEVVAMTVGDSNIDETESTSVVVDLTILLSVNVLTEVLSNARSLPVIIILDIELISLLLGVGIPSTVVVASMLKLGEVLKSTGEDMNIIEGAMRDNEVVIMEDAGGVMKIGIDEGTRMGSDMLTTMFSELTSVVIAWTDIEVGSKIELDFDDKIETLEPARDDNELMGLLDDCSTKLEDCEVVGRC